MTHIVPGREGGARRVTEQGGSADAVTIVLSRQVKAGHEQAFEAVLRLIQRARHHYRSDTRPATKRLK